MSWGSLIDSVSGAPLRAMLVEKAGTKPPSGTAFGLYADPGTAPAWGEVLGKAGMSPGKLRDIVSALADFATPLPFAGGLGIGATVKKTPKSKAEIIDIAKAIANRGPRTLDPVDKLHGNFGKIIGLSEDSLPNAGVKHLSKLHQDKRDRLMEQAWKIINTTGSTSGVPHDSMLVLHDDRLISGQLNKLKDLIASAKEHGYKAEFDPFNHQFIVTTKSGTKRMEVPDLADAIESERLLRQNKADVIKYPPKKPDGDE